MPKKAEHLSLEERRARGEAARPRIPPSSHAGWSPREGRRGPVDLIEEQNARRDADLVPVRHGRMMASPFTFYRGAAGIMAADLDGTPTAGLEVQLCGDAHLSNFGVFASPERRLVFDINDFDETLPGPFEYDVKRLAASLTVAAYNNNFTRPVAKEVTLACVNSYREAMTEFSQMRTLDVWYAHISEDDLRQGILQATTELAATTKGKGNRKDKASSKEARKLQKRFEKNAQKAHSRNSMQALSKLTEVVDGRYRIASVPPVVVPARDLHGVYEIDPEELGSTSVGLPVLSAEASSSLSRALTALHHPRGMSRGGEWSAARLQEFSCIAVPPQQHPRRAVALTAPVSEVPEQGRAQHHDAERDQPRLQYEHHTDGAISLVLALNGAREVEVQEQPQASQRDRQRNSSGQQSPPGHPPAQQKVLTPPSPRNDCRKTQQRRSDKSAEAVADLPDRSRDNDRKEDRQPDQRSPQVTSSAMRQVPDGLVAAHESSGPRIGHQETDERPSSGRRGPDDLRIGKQLLQVTSGRWGQVDATRNPRGHPAAVTQRQQGGQRDQGRHEQHQRERGQDQRLIHQLEVNDAPLQLTCRRRVNALASTCVALTDAGEAGSWSPHSHSRFR